MDEINGSEIVLANDPNLYPGWRLVDAVYKEEVVTMSEQGYDEHGCCRTTSRSMVIRNPVFVMSRPATEKIAELEKKLCDAISDCEEAKEDLNKALNKVRDLSLELEASAKRVEDRSQYVNSLLKANAGLEQSKQKLECDLGKVRKELGEARWREILG